MVLSEGRAEAAAPGDSATGLVSLQNKLYLLLHKRVACLLSYYSFIPVCFLIMRDTPNFPGIT